MMTIKNSTSIVLSIVCITFLATIFSCSKKSDPSAEEITKGFLTSGVWKISTVNAGGVDKTAAYAGMTLQFQSGSYSTTNGSPVWTTSGTWAFTDSNAKSVRREDNVIVDITTISSTSLVLSVQWNKTTLGKGRVESIVGANVFTFIK
jgi:hypothetical protein